jgi:hypothetical protein
MAEDNKIITELIVKGTEKYISDLKSTSGAIDELKTEIKEVGTDGTKAFTILGNEAESAGNEIEKTDKKTASYKTQLKQMRAEVITLTLELNKMKDAGKQGTKEFTDLDTKIKTLTNDAGSLDDVIRDVSGTVKNAGSDTRGLDRTLRVVTSVSAGFQLAQGSVALFGSENKELTNALIKLNGIMAVTNALQQIQDELLKEDSVLTGIATVGKRAYAGAVAFATGAMSLFRTALVSLGIGAFIAGIALLVENWDRLKLAIAGATGSLQRLADQREKDAQLAKDNIKNLDTELKYKIAIGQATEKSALQEKIQKETETRKKILEQYKAEKKLLNELETQKFAKVFGVEIGEKSTRKELEAQRQKVKEVDLEFMNYTISIDGARKQLTELNKTKIDKPIKEAKQSIKELKLELPIKLDVESNMELFDAKLNSLITNTETELKSLFTAELLLGNNPQDNVQIRYLIQQLEMLKKQLDEAKNKYDNLTLEKIQPKGLADISATDDTLKGLTQSSTLVKQPLTFWERLFGTEKENQTKEQLIQEQIKKAQYIVGQINEIGAGIGDVASKAIAIRANNELSALEDKKKRGLISEKEYEKESAKIKNEAAQKQRKVDIAMAIAKIPMAVLQALSSAPPPVNYALAAISGALALAQVAILASTPLPKFKEGGHASRIFKGSGTVVGKSHEQGGVNAELEGNEYVVKGDAVKKYGVKFFNDVNSLKFNPVLSMPKKALSYHKKDTKMYEHLAVISSYLKQGYKTTGKGNEILKEIQVNLNKPNGY